MSNCNNQLRAEGGQKPVHETVLTALMKYAKANPGAWIFPGWDGDRVARELAKLEQRQEPVVWYVVSDGRKHQILKNHKEANDYAIGLAARHPELVKNVRVRPLVYGDTSPAARRPPADVAAEDEAWIHRVRH